MRLLISLLAGSLAGFAAHKAYEPTKALGERWGTIARYSIGLILILPFMILFMDMLPRGNRDDDDKTRAASGLIIAGGSIGVGVVCGHLLDRMEK